MKKRKIFEPIQLGQLQLKNRIVMSPMLTYEAPQSMMTDFHKVHYGARAIGGVALINIEGTAISSNGRITNKDLGLWHQQQADALKELVTLIHQFDSKVGIQLNHAGRKAEVGERLIAPSRIAYNDEIGVPEALTTKEIDDIVTMYRQSAQYAAQANIDLIEIHMAHGYLLHQFISPITNQRTDDYGGSLEKRFKIVKRVINAIKEVYQGALWVRISGDEYVDNGTTIEELIQIAKWLKIEGIDLIDVSSGGLVPVVPPKIYWGYQVEKATIIKKQANIAVGVVGLLNDPKLGEFLLQTNQTDIISLGRPLLANPNWLLSASNILRATDDIKAYNNAYERGRII